VSRRLVDVVARGVRARGAHGEISGELDTDARALTIEAAPATTLSTDRLGVTVALGAASVVRMFARMEEGVAPEVEIGRSFAKRGVAELTPRVLGQVVYKVGRAEPVTMAIVEERIENEGTAWQQARREIERAYERVLANALGEGPPTVPREPLLELAYMEPPEAHAQLMGAYRDWANRLGRRTAELHIAMSASGERSFEPEPYTTMDQRSKYQTARNLVGRTLGALRRADLPAEVRPLAHRVIAAEEAILARFEPLLQHRFDTMRVRVHGELHLGRVLFTGKDYVLTGLGGGRERRLSERRRKGAALRDVASMVRSFHWAASTSLTTLRPEDQARGAPWAWIWQRWAAAAYVAGYLETAKDGPFVPKSPAAASMLLETTMLERAFVELRSELRRRPEMTVIPLQGILRIMNLD
jgi:maltose alpha-D-glucosyltransferase/alpha-amylase